MRAILVTSDNRALFQSELQHELDGLTAAHGTVRDVKFSTAAGLEGTHWSALILIAEAGETEIGVQLAEASVSEAIPSEELIEVIVPPRGGV